MLKSIIGKFWSIIDSSLTRWLGDKMAFSCKLRPICCHDHKVNHLEESVETWNVDGIIVGYFVV